MRPPGPRLHLPKLLKKSLLTIDPSSTWNRVNSAEQVQFLMVGSGVLEAAETGPSQSAERAGSEKSHTQDFIAEKRFSPG